ncbi:MAG TPA: hypothetical protein VK665_09180 [Candidatus Elarobacter sp.]|nr:hypothetical protein [Candidatus Elarobacter sp.]
MRLEAVAAIHRFVAARLERHFRLLPATAARHAVHLARAAAATTAVSAVAAVPAAGAAPVRLPRILPRGAAIGTPVRLVLESFGGEKLLFA